MSAFWQHDREICLSYITPGAVLRRGAVKLYLYTGDEVQRATENVMRWQDILIT